MRSWQAAWRRVMELLRAKGRSRKSHRHLDMPAFEAPEVGLTSSSWPASHARVIKTLDEISTLKRRLASRSRDVEDQVYWLKRASEREIEASARSCSSAAARSSTTHLASGGNTSPSAVASRQAFARPLVSRHTAVGRPLLHRFVRCFNAARAGEEDDAKESPSTAVTPCTPGFAQLKRGTPQAAARRRSPRTTTTSTGP